MESNKQKPGQMIVAYFISVALLTLGFGWLFRYYIHLYLVILLLTLFSGVVIGSIKSKNKFVRFISISLLCGVPLAGLLGLFWDPLLSR